MGSWAGGRQDYDQVGLTALVLHWQLGWSVIFPAVRQVCPFRRGEGEG